MEEIKQQIKMDDDIIFYSKPYYDTIGDYHDGTVIGIYDEGVMLACLYGWKSFNEIVKWEHLMIIGDKKGEPFNIRGFRGKGVILNRKILDYK